MDEIEILGIVRSRRTVATKRSAFESHELAPQRAVLSLCELGDSPAFEQVHELAAAASAPGRGRNECLYVILSARPALGADVRGAMGVLLPFPDSALRTARSAPLLAAPERSTAQRALSDRESEIMQWVKMGKTNQEIACILELSVCTVKNHLYRIFRKIDVFNRTQAVSKLERLSRHA